MVILVYKAENGDCPLTDSMTYIDIRTESRALYSAHTKEKNREILNWKQGLFGGLSYCTIYQALRFVVRPDKICIFYYQSHVVSTSYDPEIMG